MSKTPLVFAASTAFLLWLGFKKYRARGSVSFNDSDFLPNRSQLPVTVSDWSNLLDLEDELDNKIGAKWGLLHDLFLKKYQLKLWFNEHLCTQRPWPSDTSLPKPNGFNTLCHANTTKSIARWSSWGPMNGAQHVARTSSGCDVIVRVITSGGVGNNFREIQRFLNQTPDILLSTNHVLPMLEEIVFEDITFGVFPRLDDTLESIFRNSRQNSVEDALYAIMEALEGIVYLHEHHIAHQFHPESLIRRAVVRPRVYIIDFEDAVMFSPDTNPTDMRVSKFPRPLELCGRPQPPEVYQPESYCPFKLDMWQFGDTLQPFKSGFDEVSKIFEAMVKSVPEERISAAEALRRLDTFVQSQPPNVLHKPFPGECTEYVESKTGPAGKLVFVDKTSSVVLASKLQQVADGTTLALAASAALILWLKSRKTPSQESDAQALSIKLPERSELPNTIEDWRDLFDLYDELDNKIAAKWCLLDDLFRKRYGVKLWLSEHLCEQEPWPDDSRLPKPNGFNTLSHANTDHCISRWPHWCPRNGAQHVARTSTGCDVMIRVITSGGIGERHREIQRYLNRAPDILLSTNHVLPMLEEMIFEDITFGVFPRLDATLSDVFSRFYKTSVGDALDMIMQALEGVVYLHEHRIAHQDLFMANFVVQWQPESLLKRAIARPRVWIIDFEDAVMFEEGTKVEDMKVARFPRPLEECGRPQPPEVQFGSYCPFKLDVWQFSSDIKRFKSGFVEVSQVFEDMNKEQPDERITAAQALARLDSFVREQPPSSLHQAFPSFT
ncbi:hypothetical protein CVT24_012152 [Panaeolus cyanescens]|uniref:Protein kinase domain-containing protein n=1 Tax=Panaeolus cyanescens TaxID=181874 RepID=A0A409YIZ3_9AGAR|nr:hypothetical protein CVT24_012152 [Panaeolus cyanescens]